MYRVQSMCVLVCMCVCEYICAHSQPCLHMFLPSSQVMSPLWHFHFQSSSMDPFWISDSEKLVSHHPRSLLTCSVVESMAVALGSAHLPVLSILSGFSLGSSIVPGVGSSPPLRLGQWLGHYCSSDTSVTLR